MMKVEFAILVSLLMSLENAQGDSLSRSRKLPEASGDGMVDKETEYLEQCSVVNFWDEQLGHVNVLAFFDASWTLSHRQASLLKTLKIRFAKSGMSDVRFFLVSAIAEKAEMTELPIEMETERETWRNIRPEEIEEFSSEEKTVEALAETAGSGIFLVQDTLELRIWEQLHASRDQIMILDRCGRLAFQVIVPWSILHFPYVKAAILSAYKDEPCGSCNLDVDVEEDLLLKITHFPNKDETNEETDITTMEPTSEEFYTTSPSIETTINDEIMEESATPTEQDILEMSIRVIMRAPHIDDDHDVHDDRKHEFLVLKTNDADYHGHLESGEMEIRGKVRSVFDKDESPGLYGEVSDYWRSAENEGANEGNLEVKVTAGNYEDIQEQTTEPNIEIEEEETKSKLIAHYSKLLPWIYYVLKR